MGIRRRGIAARLEITHHCESADLCEEEVLPVKALRAFFSHAVHRGRASRALAAQPNGIFRFHAVDRNLLRKMTSPRC
jgi:hypothetical protein